MITIGRFFAALVLSVLCITAASAQTASSWLPSFSRDQHVYVAPAVNGILTSNFSSIQFKLNLDTAARSQNLNVYVIVTQNGGELTDTGNSSGPVLVRKLWDNWTSTSNFASRRAVVILMTGNSDGKLISVGVRAGEDLNKLGIARDTMNDENGPVRPVLRAYLDSNPALVPAKIVENISAIVAARSGSTATTIPVKTYEAPSSEPSTSPAKADPSDDSSAGQVLLLIALFGIIGAGLFVIFRRPKSSNDFESRMRASTSSRGNVNDATPTTTASTSTPPTSSTARDATMLGAGAIGGYVLGSEVARRREEERRRSDDEDAARRRRNDDSSSTPASTYTPTSSPASSCSSSTSSSSCSSSSGGSSCGGGGGSSCGGGS